MYHFRESLIERSRTKIMVSVGYWMPAYLRMLARRIRTLQMAYNRFISG
ncbi:Protein of unknown function [Pyronema omphalodes CBS 100304]|uniref:Uncharacterized protein n=1 Tax=Pyronema omphalodes (strain CBS 100304) TaxID=1076935 RepID=U4L8P1_PYROM|nr:Protein of unknown function [Pyronema omphalodes CBS 100304]